MKLSEVLTKRQQDTQQFREAKKTEKQETKLPKPKTQLMPAALKKAKQSEKLENQISPIVTN